MYTIQENVRIVIAMLKQYNIRYMVLNPGGTNIPIVQAVQNDHFFTCYSVPDERSAMYFAIGLYLQTGEVVATSCTSAQATRNYIPGLTEAFYKHVPILAITTSKLERFQYQDYMQAPDQCSLPKDSVKKTFDLPPITDDNTRMQCYHNAKEAILELTHHGLGPVQLNIRIVDIQQGKFENVELPKVKPLKRYMAWEEWSDVYLNNKKILIVVGEHRPFTIRQQKAIDAFCEHYDVAVYVNHLSNFHNQYSLQANLLVASGGLRELTPDIIITIGGQTGDYPIYGALCGLKNAEHWRVSEDGLYVDTYCKLTKIFECPDYYFFERFVKEGNVEHEYFNSWLAASNCIDYNTIVPFSNLYVAQQMHDKIPQGSIMNFAILNCLRCWSYFPLDASINCYANVAAFGIDGCNSMLIGESMNTDEMCFIVTGDLAFFYDMNALGIRHINKNLRVLLINNSGGAEFKLMTQNWTEKVDTEKYISACGHNGTAKGWAEDSGFNYLNASSKSEFLSKEGDFLSSSDSPILFEIFTQSEDEQEAIDLFLKSNKIVTISDKFRKVAVTVLGNKGKEMVKKILNK